MDVYEAILTTVSSRGKTKEQIIQANSQWSPRVVTAALRRLRLAGVIDRSGDSYTEAGMLLVDINKAKEPYMDMVGVTSGCYGAGCGDENAVAVHNAPTPKFNDPGLPGGGSIMDDRYLSGRAEAWDILREAGVA